MASVPPDGPGTLRRATALVGLALSGAVAAGAVVAWLAWRVPDTVRLTDSRAPAGLAAPTPVVAKPPVAPPAPTSNPQAMIPGPIASVSPPVRIHIPSEGIAAPVVPEGLDRTGSLIIPPPANVGWYEGGPMPGQSGSTLIAGHINQDGVPGAFVHLNAVPIGAPVTLTTADGSTLHFTVTNRLSVPQTGLAASGLLTRSGPSQLVLITCGGSYNSSTHHYLDNIVVIASPTVPPEAVQ